MHLAPARARPAAPPGSAARRWRTARRQAACRCCARPARGAATGGAAAIPGLQAHHLAGSAGQRLLGQTKQKLLGFLRAHLPGLCRQDESQLPKQVMPGPGRMLARHQHQGLGQCPCLGLARGRSGRRPAGVMLARLRAGAAHVRHTRRDPGQFPAEGGVPPPRERVPVDRARVLTPARLERGGVGDVQQLARGRHAAMLALPRPRELAFLLAHLYVPSASNRRPTAPA